MTGLCVGRSGLVEHFGLRAHSRHDDVPWSAVVRIEGEIIWSRKELGRFPDIAELKQLVRDRVAPDRDLGHADR